MNQKQPGFNDLERRRSLRKLRKLIKHIEVHVRDEEFMMSSNIWIDEENGKRCPAGFLPVIQSKWVERTKHNGLCLDIAYLRMGTVWYGFQGLYLYFHWPKVFTNALFLPGEQAKLSGKIPEITVLHNKSNRMYWVQLAWTIYEYIERHTQTGKPKLDYYEDESNNTLKVLPTEPYFK